jgi:hypothetical protein
MLGSYTYVFVHETTVNKFQDSGNLRKLSIEKSLLLVLIDHRLAELNDGSGLSIGKLGGVFRFKEVDYFG